MDIGDVTTLANPEIVEQIRIMVQGEAKVATKAAPGASVDCSGMTLVGPFLCARTCDARHFSCANR